MGLHVLQGLACSEVGVAGEQEALEADDELADVVQAAALPLPGLALALATSRLLDCLLCKQPGMCHQCSLGSVVAAEPPSTARAPCCGQSTMFPSGRWGVCSQGQVSMQVLAAGGAWSLAATQRLDTAPCRQSVKALLRPRLGSCLPELPACHKPVLAAVNSLDHHQQAVAG